MTHQKYDDAVAQTVSSLTPSDDFAGLQPFPAAAEILQGTQVEWDWIAASSAGMPDDLPRPWEPATCTQPDLTAELHTWLVAAVDWLNSQHAWDPDGLIPDCWARHPHLVHDLAVLADQRRRASNTPTSDALENWHRTTLPAFRDRLHTNLRYHCADGHQPPPRLVKVGH